MAEKLCNLEKIGGGGGSSAKTKVVLFDTPTNATSGTILLSDDITKYDEVEFIFAYYESSTQPVGFCHFAECLVTKELISIALANYSSSGYGGLFDVSGQYYVDFYINYGLKIPTTTSLSISQKLVKGWGTDKCYLYKIIGYKYS